ncbi:hypothetical protein MMC28_010962 [Mycoblastus sanguinarius]|nr:hypothetical protein [Mycoblastus sanguinarius]
MTCLLPITDSLACAEAEQCGVCTALKLNPNRFLVLPGDYECMNASDGSKVCLELVENILKKGSCPFSRLAVAIVERAEVSSGQDSETILRKGSDGPSPGVNQFWDYTHQIFSPRPYAHMLNGGRVQSIQLNQLPQSSDTPIPSNDSEIDFTMIRNWISLCRIYHGEECNKAKLQDHEIGHPSNEIPSFRVIDVVQNCLVGDVEKCDYITLSYVWGQVEVLRTLKSNIKILSRPGALELPEFQEKIPWTVRDAMRVTKEIGFRYLWIDSLCIIQDDDTGEKTEAISKMDLVYGAAFLVIVAVMGRNANSGLAGVSLINRNFQKVNETNPSNLPQAFESHPIDPMRDRVYYSRGWTFQERFFARRELIFNGDQALFSCSFDREVHEKVVFDHNVPNAIFRPQRKEGTGDIAKFEELIRDYTMRDLSYESDIHNAFAGIARYISSGLKTSLCHGIPRAFLDWMLLWDHSEPLQRREKAPSWSWAGWIGRSWPHIWQWYHANIQKVRMAQRKRTWITWYERIAHESSECIRICEDTCSSKEGLKTLENASGCSRPYVKTVYLQIDFS